MTRLSRRRLLDLLLVLVALGLLLGIWAGAAALSARAHLLEARAQVDAVRTALTAGVSDSGALADRVRTARDEAEGARTELSRPGPALAARLPLVGNTLTSERAVAEAAATAFATADEVLPALDALRTGTSGAGIDLAGLARVSDLVRGARAQLRGPVATLDTASSRRVLPGTGAAFADAKKQVDELADLLARTDDTLTGVLGLLGRPGAGDRTVVLAVMNNAELRGAGGYASSVSVVRSRDGIVDVGPFQDTNDFDDNPAVARTVPAPPGYVAAYGRFQANSTTWKNVLMSSDGPASASVLCEVARLAPGVPCDGVVLVDVPALAELATLTGPVTLPSGEQLSGDALLRGLLIDAYAQPVSGEPLDQTKRRADLRAAGDGALRSLLAGQADLLGAGRALLDAAQGRHLVLWSADPTTQQALVAAGVSGATDPGTRDLQLTAENQLSTGKLDVYVDRSVTLTAVVDRDVAHVTQSVTLGLDLPDGLGTYVSGLLGGDLGALLELGLAREADLTSVTVDGQDHAFGRTTRNGAQRVDLYELVPNHRQRTVQITYDVPLVDGRYEVVLLPQPLARDAALSVSIIGAPGTTLVGGPVAITERYDTIRTLAVQAVG